MPINNEMLKLTVEFSTENAAFENNKKWEINSILEAVVDYILYQPEKTNGTIHDSNGNLIGRWFIGEDTEHTDKEVS